MFVFLFLLAFGFSVLAVIKNRELADRLMAADARKPKQFILEEDEDVLSLLEAAATVSNFAGRVLTKAREMKALPAAKPPEKPQPKPEWMHNTQIAMPSEVHWEMFVSDMNREEDPNDKLKVLRFWVIEQENRFTTHECGLILDIFKEPEDRQAVRNVFAEQKRKTAKKAPTPKKKVGATNTGPG